MTIEIQNKKFIEFYHQSVSNFFSIDGNIETYTFDEIEFEFYHNPSQWTFEVWVDEIKIAHCDARLKDALEADRFVMRAVAEYLIS